MTKWWMCTDSHSGFAWRLEVILISTIKSLLEDMKYLFNEILGSHNQESSELCT